MCVCAHTYFAYICFLACWSSSGGPGGEQALFHGLRHLALQLPHLLLLLLEFLSPLQQSLPQLLALLICQKARAPDRRHSPDRISTQRPLYINFRPLRRDPPLLGGPPCGQATAGEMWNALTLWILLSRSNS